MCGKSSKMKRNKVEEAIFKMLGHSERKRILNIIAESPKGIHYSGILEESGLATNKLNYQIREMDGFISKEEGVYRLSTLGIKAVGVLDYMSENIDVESVDSELFKVDERSKYVKKSVDGFLKVIMGIFLIGPLVGTYIFFSQPGELPLWALWMIIITCGGFSLLFTRARVTSPAYMLGFVDWLDWKFFNGNGVVDFKGQKVFVMAVMGLIIGALFGKMILGLIIGSFLGTAMEL